MSDLDRVKRVSSAPTIGDDARGSGEAHLSSQGLLQCFISLVGHQAELYVFVTVKTD